MVGRRTKGAARPRVNRLLGFAGRPTDAEVDEVIELVARMFMRMVASSQFLEMVGTATRLQQRFGGFGDA